MSKYSSENITLMQYIFIISGTQVGIGVLTLPGTLAEKAGTDGWLSIIIGWLFSVLVSIVIIQIMKKHPQCTIFDISRKYLGKWLGRAVSLSWVLYSFFAVVTLILTAIFIIQVWILPETNSSSLLLIFIVPIYIITKGGLKVIGRFSEFVFFATMWMPILLTIPVQNGHLLNLLPVIKEGWWPILSAVQATFLSFLGFELAFVLYPFLENKKSAIKGIFIANSITLLVYIHITIISYVYFSPDEIKQYIWATLNLIKPIQLPFLERFEIIFLSFYLFVISDTIIPYLFTAVLGVNHITGIKGYRIPLILFIVMLMLITNILPITYEQVMQLGEWWGYIGLILAFLFPIIFWIYTGLYDRLLRRPKS
ncbi:MAG: spore gernimation protein [Firmicutes bacterium]|nr:spore gernimation protein [Bacillota bacterium]